MSSILKFSCDLYEVIVIQFYVLQTLELGANINSAISDTKIISAPPIEITSNAEGLQNEWPLKPSADVHDCVF